jgi:hypothetical protein
MAKPWPERDDAIAMPVDELALRLLDRLELTADDPMHSLLRKDWFVNGEVTRYVSERRRVDGAMTATHSDEALAAEPELARAWSEAWGLAVREGWVADDPARGGCLYVTSRGRDALGLYRNRSDVSALPVPGPTPPVASRAEAKPCDRGDADNATPAQAAGDGEVAPTSPASVHRPIRFGRFFVEQWKLVGAPIVVVVVGGILLYHFTDGRRSPSPPTAAGGPVTTSPSSTGPTTAASKFFTVQNDVSHGAWIVAAPNLPRLYPRDRRPASAKRWVQDGTRLSLICAKKATPYAIIVNLKKVKWRWWTQVAGGGWIPVAPLKEALEDGSQGLPLCR